MTGNLSFGDNDKAQFGAGNDLQIYHNGSNSYIADEGTGDLAISGSTNVRFAPMVAKIWACLPRMVRPHFTTTMLLN